MYKILRGRHIIAYINSSHHQYDEEHILAGDRTRYLMWIQDYVTTIKGDHDCNVKTFRPINSNESSSFFPPSLSLGFSPR